MSEPYIGEIRMFAGNFAPRGFALCNGQILAIAQNTALFSLIGTTYGGNGVTTFQLPDLRGRAPIHQGQGPGLSQYELGQAAGAETITLITQEIPAHRHAFVGSGGGGSSPAGELLGTPSGDDIFTSGPVSGALAGVSTAGGGEPHDNVMPSVVINFIIALQGVFPSRN